jgi:hypothetical protein
MEAALFLDSLNFKYHRIRRIRAAGTGGIFIFFPGESSPERKRPDIGV